MKVRITSKVDAAQYVDLDGSNDPEKVAVVGPRATVTVDVASERQFIELSKTFRNKLILRKV